MGFKLRCHSSGDFYIILRDTISLAWDSPIRLGWLDSKPERSSPVSASLALEKQAEAATSSFCMGFGEQTEVLMLARQKAVLSHLSSPTLSPSPTPAL